MNPCSFTPSKVLLGLGSNLYRFTQRSSCPSSTTLAFSIRTWSIGLSSAPVFTSPILCTTLNPLFTLPNIVCFPSSHGVGASVILLNHESHTPYNNIDTTNKNWLPLVFGPLFAMLNTPAPVCLREGSISSSNFSP